MIPLRQLTLFTPPEDPAPVLGTYDRFVIAFSGGKDSLATLLHLYEAAAEAGVDLSGRVECWHHCVDGAPGSPAFFDWPVTVDYCVYLGTIAEYTRSQLLDTGIDPDDPLAVVRYAIDHLNPIVDLDAKVTYDCGTVATVDMVTGDVTEKL